MKWFKNLKISVKLLSAFLIIALIAGGVGLYGIVSLSNASKDNDTLFKNYGDSQGYLGYILSDFMNQRMLVRDALMYLLFSEDTRIDSDIKMINSDNEDMAANLNKYKQTCLTDEDKANYTAVETAIITYSSIRDKITAAEQKDDYAGARSLLSDAATIKSAGDAQTAIETAVAKNVEIANKALDADNSSVNKTIIIMIALVAAAAGLAAVSGLFLTRIIAKPIRRLAGIANRIAAGDMTVKKTPFKQKDEVGEMYESVRAIFDAIQKLMADVNMLTGSAINGDLSLRADETQHQGEYRRIIEGMNGTLDAIIDPVRDAMGVIQEISKGNLSVSAKGEYKGDYAVFRDAINGTANMLKDLIGELSMILGKIASGDLTSHIERSYRGDFAALRESINDIASSLNNVIGEIDSAADRVASGSRQVSGGMQETSQGAAEQAGSIEELTSSITDIAEQTRQNAKSADTASELTLAVKNGAAHGNEQMKAMQQAMNDINESSRNIRKIIKVIDDIAFQTNMLALNAAVEAARAGVHGKGFAVVAEEVRNLAARSADAAKETTGLIEGSIKKTEAGTKIAGDTARAFSGIAEGVDKAALLVSEIARASNEQAGAIAQVNSGIEQISRIVQTNSATAEEGAAASEELSSQAELLKNMVGRFRLRGKSQETGSSETVPAAKNFSFVESALKDAAVKISDSDLGKY